MRVIAGAAKGHRLAVPPGRGTRPTSDRVREALFSSLQRRLPGASVLDLYAGSGALGIEALSRGAAAATFVERAAVPARTVSENLVRTGLAGDARVLTDDVRAVLRQAPPGAPYDVVLADPPYDLAEEELAEVLRLVANHLVEGGLVVVERSRRAPAPAWPGTLRAGRTRRYGDTVLHEAERAPSTIG